LRENTGKYRNGKIRKNTGNFPKNYDFNKNDVGKMHKFDKNSGDKMQKFFKI
jgi:hypothetical protein